MSVEENMRLVREVIEAYNEHDLDLLVAFWADEGMGLARKEFQRDFWLAAFPDTNMEIISMTAQDDCVVAEAIVRATHAGPLRMWVKEPIPATNRRIEFQVCEVAHWENGKLTGLKAYFDVSSIIGQLGLSESFDWNQGIVAKS